MSVKIIFRDDDVGDCNDSFMSLIDQVFLNRKIPVSLAIIPERLTSKKNKLLIQYLIDIKNKFPKLIEFHQHGYNHQKESFECCIPNYQEQFHRISKGLEILQKYFGDDDIAPVFTPPSHRYNSHTIKILKNLSFKYIFRFSRDIVPQTEAPDFDEDTLHSIFSYFDPTGSYEYRKTRSEEEIKHGIDEASKKEKEYLIIHLHHWCMNKDDLQVLNGIMDYLLPLGKFYTVMQAFT